MQEQANKLAMKKKALLYWLVISLLVPCAAKAETAPEVLEQIARITSVDDETSLDAARKLAEMGDKTLEALKDKDDRVRIVASWALAKTGYKPALPYFIQILQEEKEIYEVCDNAAWGLGNIGDPSAIPALVKALGNESDRDRTSAVRRETQDSLTTFGKAAVPFLLKAIEERRNEPVGIWMRDRTIHSICIVLGRIKDTSAVPALYKLLTDEDPAVSGYGAEAICSMSDEAVIYDLIKYAMQQSKASLTKAAQEKKITNESSAEDMLWFVEQGRILGDVGAALESAGEPMVPVLIKALQHKDWEIRFFAVGALPKFVRLYPAHTQQITDALTQKLSDEHKEIRGLTRESLHEITGKDCGEEGVR
jgi:HEAT repeat protein